MSEWRDAIEDAREDARKARQEASRLRDEARKLERRLREEARQERRKARQEHRNARRETSQDNADESGPASEQSFQGVGLKTVRVDQTAGHLSILLCGEGETPGIRSVGQRQAPELEVQRRGDELTISIRLSRGWLFRRRHGARTTVKLNPDALDHLNADVGYGTLRIENIQTETMRLHVGAGDIGATACSGDVDVEVGAGRISLNEHSGLVHGNVGTGDATADIAEARPGRYTLDAGMGRVELRLPAGESAHVDLSSGIGRRRVEYPDGGPDAPIQVRLSTGIGEALVKTRSDKASRETARATPRETRSTRTATRRREADELRILQMLEQGKLTSQEAAELIAALHGAPAPDPEDIDQDDQFLNDGDLDRPAASASVEDDEDDPDTEDEEESKDA